MPPVPKRPPLRDRAYLDSLRGQRCILTGVYASPSLAIDPAHISTLGRSMKSPDNEALPIRHDIHHLMHQRGEISVLREIAPDDVLRRAFRALARELYEEWKNETDI
jgi:hypothetical protein